MNRMAVLLALCVGCADGGDPGRGLLPGTRTPVPVGDAAELAVDAGADRVSADLALSPDADRAELPPPAPDVGPPDVPPAFPACAMDVDPIGGEMGCTSPAGSCRTAAGRVCYVCNVAAPCEWSRNLTNTEGPMCSLARICVPAAMGCAVMAGGERCRVPRDGGS